MTGWGLTKFLKENFSITDSTYYIIFNHLKYSYPDFLKRIHL